MHHRQAEIVQRCVDGLSGTRGIAAIALGGSFARGTAGSDSDIDLGLYYWDTAPPDLPAIRSLAADLHDLPDPVVTELYEWGAWVNGGAWLTIEGQRVDLIYRSLDQVNRVIADSRAGRTVNDFWQQPPYGFFSYIYLGELHTCQPLHDPNDILSDLKASVRVYPEALKRTIVQGHLWAAVFTAEYAPKVAARGDIYTTVGFLTRTAASLTQVLFALNETYFVSDKGAVTALDQMRFRPDRYGERVPQILARAGDSADELVATTKRMLELCQEVIELAGPLYRRLF
ncbi:MAG: DUF4037 domain-containing protein [Chloroflexi bacterium]|nr:DUF4037 domain-containing protein [Chloroflexota bacterium]